ncbi:MAG: glycosyltransferase family 2 protein [Chloroflexota bacterium]|nr:MAG: hypothetical protein DLM70_11230 [Chloroflexota bacterium]
MKVIEETEVLARHERRRAPRTGRQFGSAWQKQDIDVTVILPAYNEAAALPSVLDDLFQVLGGNIEVIVVDDASNDNTVAIACRYACRVLSHEHNRGKGSAVRTGLNAARGNFIVVMDADNTYPASAIPDMVTLSKEYDFVRCVRSEGTDNIPFLNRVGNKVFDGVLKLVHGLEGGDHLSGLYGLRREALNTIGFRADRFDLEVEIGIKARAHKLQAITVPISYSERLGEKKLNAYRDGWSILHRVLAMALLYNPGLMFVAPGLLIWGMTAVLCVVLSIHTLTLGALTLSSDTLVFASFGVTVGFQLVVFGTAAALYSVERGAPPTEWLVAMGRRGVRLSVLLLGAAFATAGCLTVIVLAAHWMFSGGHDFHATSALVLAGASVSWGAEAILGALFISIFAPQLASEVHAPQRPIRLASPAEEHVIDIEPRALEVLSPAE